MDDVGPMLEKLYTGNCSAAVVGRFDALRYIQVLFAPVVIALAHMIGTIMIIRHRRGTDCSTFQTPRLRLQSSFTIITIIIMLPLLILLCSEFVQFSLEHERSKVAIQREIFIYATLVRYRKHFPDA